MSGSLTALSKCHLDQMRLSERLPVRYATTGDVVHLLNGNSSVIAHRRCYWRSILSDLTFRNLSLFLRGFCPVVSMCREAFLRIAGDHHLFQSIEPWNLRRYVTLALYLDLLQPYPALPW
jgi:hypothetical protein